MNTKIEFNTNQCWISKLEILLQDAKSWTWQLIESAPMVYLSPLWEWKSKESKLNSLYTTYHKVSPEMSIHKTMDQSKILFDETAQQLSIKIHEHAFWMVSNLGRTCPFVLNLMNITKAERNSTCSIEMNVPKKCKKSKECLQIFSTAGAPAYASVPMVLQYRF
jgi:hypothetical protein